jgi:hypothetical protein
MQLKTITSARGETRLVKNQWAAEAESRGATVSTSTWVVCGDLTLGSASLAGSLASVIVNINGCGSITNTVTLSNGEVLVGTRDVTIPGAYDWRLSD